MGKVGESESEKTGFWDKSPLSTPWTIAVVFLLIVFFFVAVKVNFAA